MDSLVRDLRYALRTLVRNPLFGTIVVVTLALGIGANTAIFTVVDAVLLKSLPYYQPDRLLTVWLDMSRRGGPAREWFTYPDFEDYRDESGLFQGMAAWDGWNPTLTGAGEAEVVRGASVTQGMFSSVFKVRAVLGRAFTAADDVPGAAGVVLLSYGAWQRRYGGDPAVLGRTLFLDEQPYTVVGVLPEGMRLPFTTGADVYRAMRFDASQCGRGCFTIRTVARLAPGVSLARARTRASALAARLASAYPDTNAKVGVTLTALRDDVVGDAARPLWILLGAVGFVLLIACVNVAGLLLARSAGRAGEMAVRTAVGAGRGAIIRQLLTESVVLAALGGVAGLALASFGTSALLALAPQGAVPRIDSVMVDGRVLAFTALLTLLTGVLFGLVPAWRVARGDVYAGLRAGRRGARSGHPGLDLRGVLVVMQVALALVLLVGAGLLVRSFQHLSGEDLGFHPRGVLALHLALPSDRYDQGPERVAFYESLLDRLSALRGVTRAGATAALPLAGDNQDADMVVEGEPPPDPTENHAAWVRPITRGYLETMGLHLLGGRSFRDTDDADAPKVVMVNEALVKRYFDGQTPLGRRVAFGNGPDHTWRTVVGLVGDSRHFGLRQPTRPAVYLPYRQVPFAAMSVVLKVVGDPAAMAPQVRAALAELDPRLAASSVRPLSALVNQALAPDRFISSLLGVFALLALVMAAVGLYGVVSYGVTRRLREIGIRVALGAEGSDVRRMVVRAGLRLAGAGVALGLAGALALTRVLGSLLYDVRTTDPLTFLATSALLGAVAALASWLPARRAGRTDPMRVLRQE